MPSLRTYATRLRTAPRIGHEGIDKTLGAPHQDLGIEGVSAEARDERSAAAKEGRENDLLEGAFENGGRSGETI